jgi:hypothetical protein
MHHVTITGVLVGATYLLLFGALLRAEIRRARKRRRGKPE